MARYKFRKESIKPEISMSPLIDMVFLLLIFFVVTSTFKKDTGIKIERPKAKNVMEIEIKPKQNILAISKDNKIIFNKEEVDEDELQILTKDMKNQEESFLLVIPDKNSGAGKLIKVLDILTMSDYTNYSIAVEEEDGK